MNSFTIKDLANLSGIKAHTLRIWEQRYNFLKPHRTDTNIRFYSNDELKTVLNIALLNKYGFKISHIDKMSDNEVKEKILSLNHTEAQQDRVVHDLIEFMIDMNTGAFERTLNEFVKCNGIERTILQVVFPFLEKVGILWLTNHIFPAQEHLVSNIIRQKLISGIEAVDTTITSRKTMLLFLPDGEYHELGLLFMHFQLKTRGIGVIYVGASVSLKDLVYLVKHKKPDFLYTHLTPSSQNFNFERFLSNTSELFSQIPLVISGQVTCSYAKKIPTSVVFKQSYPEMMDFINGL